MFEDFYKMLEKADANPFASIKWNYMGIYASIIITFQRLV